MDARTKDRSGPLRLAICLAACVALALLSGCATSRGSVAGPGGEPFSPELAALPGEEGEKLELTAAEYEQLGDRYARQGNAEQAFLNYRKALQVDPEQTEVQYKIGMLFFQRGMMPEAEAAMRAVIAEDSSHAGAHSALGHILLRSHRLRDAEPTLRRAVELDETSWEAHCDLGVLLNYQHRPEEAIESFQIALVLAPDKATIYNNQGIALCLAGQYREAVERFQRAVAQGGKNPKIYNNLGFALFALGRYREALSAFAKAGGEARAYNNLGVLLLRRGDRRAAIDCFRKAIELEPSFYPTASENLERAIRDGRAGAAETSSSAHGITGPGDFRNSIAPAPERRLVVKASTRPAHPLVLDAESTRIESVLFNNAGGGFPLGVEFDFQETQPLETAHGSTFTAKRTYREDLAGRTLPVRTGTPVPSAEPHYTVMVSSLRSPCLAQYTAGRYRARGYDSYVKAIDMGESGIWYRVSIGNTAQQADMGELERQLKDEMGLAAEDARVVTF